MDVRRMRNGRIGEQIKEMLNSQTSMMFRHSGACLSMVILFFCSQH